MKKKIYSQPALRVKELECVEMLAGSNEPSALSLNGDTDEYGDDERPGVSSDIWGKQW